MQVDPEAWLEKEGIQLANSAWACHLFCISTQYTTGRMSPDSGLILCMVQLEFVLKKTVLVPAQAYQIQEQAHPEYHFCISNCVCSATTLIVTITTVLTGKSQDIQSLPYKLTSDIT